jgi:putative intracellular protease/amidase
MTDALVDGNLITAPGWPALGAYLSKLLTALGTQIQP